jgi:nitrogen fixation protein FixH
LGWSIQLRADTAGRPVLALLNARGTPLTGAAVQASAERPVGDALTTALTFQEVAPGRYTASASLPLKGQWDIMLTATAAGHDITTTRRIVVW